MRARGQFTRRTTLLFASIAVVVAACGSSDPEVEEIDADVATLLQTSATAMGQVDTVRFEIERGGVPVYIDTTGTLEFKDAVGRFVAPQAASKAAISSEPVRLGVPYMRMALWPG